MNRPTPPFAAQRLVYFALLFGMTAYAITAAVVLQLNEGLGLAEEPIEILDTVALVIGATSTVMAIAIRMLLRKRTETLTGKERAAARFTSVLVPLAVLEGGCLLSITAWMLNGAAVPSLAVALVLLAVAIAIVPFSDPDAA